VDLLDDAGADLIDPTLVEADDDRGDGGVFRHEVAANELVVQGAAADLCGRLRRVRVDQAPHVDAVARRADCGDGGETCDALHGVDALDRRRHVADEIERRRREEPIRRVGFERDDERAAAAEFVAKALVIAIDGIVLREPGADVVVDVRDVGVRREGERGEDDQRRQRIPPAPEPVGETPAHLIAASSSRRVKASSFRPTS
jgi:hypothetical protein